MLLHSGSMGRRPPGSAHAMACPCGYRPGNPGDKRAGARIPMGHAFLAIGCDPGRTRYGTPQLFRAHRTCASDLGASDLGRPWVGIAWVGRAGTHGDVVWGGRRGRAAHPLVGDIRMSRGCFFRYTPPGGDFLLMATRPCGF